MVNYKVLRKIFINISYYNGLNVKLNKCHSCGGLNSRIVKFKIYSHLFLILYIQYEWLKIWHAWKSRLVKGKEVLLTFTGVGFTIIVNAGS